MTHRSPSQRRRTLRAAVHDHRESARLVGLVHVDDRVEGITRRRSGKGFTYALNGARVTDKAT